MAKLPQKVQLVKQYRHAYLYQSAREMRGLNRSTRCTLLVYCSFADPDGTNISVSNETMAQLLECGKSMFKQYKKELLDRRVLIEDGRVGRVSRMKLQLPGATPIYDIDNGTSMIPSQPSMPDPDEEPGQTEEFFEDNDIRMIFEEQRYLPIAQGQGQLIEMSPVRGFNGTPQYQVIDQAATQQRYQLPAQQQYVQPAAQYQLPTPPAPDPHTQLIKQIENIKRMQNAGVNIDILAKQCTRFGWAPELQDYVFQTRLENMQELFAQEENR
jgi:hypothetical protein